MTNITRRSCDYRHDHQLLTDFWLACRAAADVRRYPTLWRTRLLLSSRVWNPAQDTQIWEDESHTLLGFAMLWRRQSNSPYVVLDVYLRPGGAAGALWTDILQWGDRRAHQIAHEQHTALTAYVTEVPPWDFAVKTLSQYGYKVVLPSPTDHDVYFSRPLQDTISLPALPPGYTIRPLSSVDELQTYQALSGFAKVDSHHQKEQFESDEYHHLVVVNPAGQFAAYCECSICFAEWERTSRRLGWIDYVETKPDEQRQGLGRAILAAGLLRLQALGATDAMLITINSNDPAVSLYNQAGFHRVEFENRPNYEKLIVVPGAENLEV